MKWIAYVLITTLALLAEVVLQVPGLGLFVAISGVTLLRPSIPLLFFVSILCDIVLLLPLGVSALLFSGVLFVYERVRYKGRSFLWHSVSWIPLVTLWALSFRGVRGAVSALLVSSLFSVLLWYGSKKVWR